MKNQDINLEDKLNYKVIIAFYKPTADLDLNTFKGNFYSFTNSIISWYTKVPLYLPDQIIYTSFSHVEIIINGWSYCVKSGAQYAFKVQRNYNERKRYTFIQLNVTRNEFSQILDYCELTLQQRPKFSSLSLYYNFMIPSACGDYFVDKSNINSYELLTPQFTRTDHITYTPQLIPTPPLVDININKLGKRAIKINVYEEDNTTFCSKMVVEALIAANILIPDVSSDRFITSLISPNELYRLLILFKNKPNNMNRLCLTI